MTWATWAWMATGWLVGLAGAAVVAWALLGDRARQVRRGRARRCPRCWYSMEGVPGRRCPECGREAKRERGLLKSRRRWRRAAVGAVVIAAGFAVHAAPGVRQHGWITLLPDRALAALTGETTDWRLQDELHRRWEERRLSRSARRAMADQAIRDLAEGHAGDVFMMRELAHEHPQLLSAITDAIVQGEDRAVRIAAIDLYWLFAYETSPNRRAELRPGLVAAAGDATVPNYTRNMAVRGLWFDGSEEAVAALRPLLDDPVVGGEAAKALLAVDPDLDAVEALARKLSQQTQPPAGAILGAIKRLGMQQPWAVEFFAAHIEVGQFREHASARAGIDQAAEPRIVAALETVARNSAAAPGEARAAALALAAIRGERSYAEGLAREFRSGDLTVQVWTLNQMYCFDVSAGAAPPPLEAIVDEGLQSDVPSVYDAAVQAAAHLDRTGERFAPAIARQRWSIHPQIRDRARRTMRELEIWSGWDF